MSADVTARVVVIVDIFTKTTILRATTKTATTEQIANLLFEAVIAKGFCPAVIISDHDRKYVSDGGLLLAVVVDWLAMMLCSVPDCDSLLPN